MARGISLHIGLNYVDPNHYSGWDGKLNACEFDASDMELIANSCGFNSTKLLREQATREKVFSFIENVSSELKSGDIFLVTYSGHGGQVPDYNSDEKEDGLDETWCLYDGEFIDDELRYLWTLFEEGVRVLVFSDSCHSGTVIKEIGDENQILRRSDEFSQWSIKSIPDEVSSRNFFRNIDFYEGISSKMAKFKGKEIKASVKLISGCQDNQYSYDGRFNGQFTGRLKTVWNRGAFNGSYKKFHKEIAGRLPEYQSPNYLNIGKLDLEFNKQKPFQI
ncbi:hypothetical protein BTO06_09730 [Tenacibaculum sp. SZ-18]|uniref:caspase family protein n=1 Tax=Tenacibaculum sp. SZ-18 TaxID=754423 RepID=UPI000C2D351D|nr:caspase family protein [Tenacibaculum sp. SZ-18]AUC15399.1 hypothetical protein BTO06_09730 [Tenacibaculum sp. SZ-18]